MRGLDSEYAHPTKYLPYIQLCMLPRVPLLLPDFQASAPELSLVKSSISGSVGFPHTAQKKTHREADPCRIPPIISMRSPTRSNATRHGLHELLKIALLRGLLGGESCTDMAE